MSNKTLIPADHERCQVEYKEGSFMTLGPRSMVRCVRKPIYVVTEKEPGPDGQRGSMSMCEEHYQKFVLYDNRDVQIDIIVRRSA
jgi:hypothetical protein